MRTSATRRSAADVKSLPERSEPKYRSIREAIRESIVNGSYSAGQRLPDEDELGTHFGASRNTVIRASDTDDKHAGRLHVVLKRPP